MENALSGLNLFPVLILSKNSFDNGYYFSRAVTKVYFGVNM